MKYEMSLYKVNVQNFKFIAQARIIFVQGTQHFWLAIYNFIEKKRKSQTKQKKTLSPALKVVHRF